MSCDTILVGPSAIPYSPCSHCGNMCLPGELEHVPGFGSDCYLCQHCLLEAQERQAEDWDATHYGE